MPPVDHPVGSDGPTPLRTSPISEATARVLAELTANARPAATVWHLDGWVLRHSPEVPFRSSNSVLALAHHGRTPLDEKIDLVEGLYGRAGRPSRFLWSPASEPRGLEDRLAARGYEPEPGADVRTVDLDRLRSRTDHPLAAAVERHPGVDERWVAAWREAGGTGPVDAFAHAYAALLRRVGPPLVAASLTVDGVPVATALGVAERGWLGVHRLAVHVDHRRRGAATALLHDLAAWGGAHGATRAYLLVEADNEAAAALYGRAGFEHASSYRYLTRPARVGPD